MRLKMNKWLAPLALLVALTCGTALVWAASVTLNVQVVSSLRGITNLIFFYDDATDSNDATNWVASAHQNIQWVLPGSTLDSQYPAILAAGYKASAGLPYYMASCGVSAAPCPSASQGPAAMEQYIACAITGASGSFVTCTTTGTKQPSFIYVNEPDLTESVAGWNVMYNYVHTNFSGTMYGMIPASTDGPGAALDYLKAGALMDFVAEENFAGPGCCTSTTDDWAEIATVSNLVAGTGGTAGTYTSVPLTGGTGINAQATIVVSGGGVTSVTPTLNRSMYGSGYTVGDTLSAASGSIGGTTGFSIKVAATARTAYPNVWFGEMPVSTASICTTKEMVLKAFGGVDDFEILWNVNNYVHYSGIPIDADWLANAQKFAASNDKTICSLPQVFAPGGTNTPVTPPNFAVSASDNNAWPGWTPVSTVSICQYQVVSGASVRYGPTLPGSTITQPWTNRTCNGSFTVTVGASGMCRLDSGSDQTCIVMLRDQAANGSFGDTIYLPYYVSGI